MLCIWAGGTRGIPAQQSPAIRNCSCFTLLRRKPGPNRLCWLARLGNTCMALGRWLYLGLACEEGQWPDWKPVCVVQAQNFCADLVRRQLYGTAWGEGEPATLGGTWESKSREEGYTAALLHHCKPRHKSSTGSWGMGIAASLSHLAHFSEEFWPLGLYLQGGKNWCQKETCWRYHSTNGVVTCIMSWCECFWSITS